MITSIFSETFEVFEKNKKLFIKCEIAKMYIKISERYKIPFNELVKRCKYIDVDDKFNTPEFLDSRRFCECYSSELQISFLKDIYKNVDKAKCVTLERLAKETNGLVDISTCLDLIVDTHKIKPINGDLCCGITSTKGKVCMKRAITNIGDYPFCSKHAKHANINNVPTLTSWNSSTTNSTIITSDRSAISQFMSDSDDETDLPIKQTVYK